MSFVLVLAPEVAAQPQGAAQTEQGLPTDWPEGRKENTRKLQQQAQRFQEREKKAEQQRMDAFKKKNPAGYAQLQETLKRNKEIGMIVTRARSKEITNEEAEKALAPLVRQELRYELNGLDGRIARLQKKLDFLKQAQRDPDVLVHQRVQELLEKRPPIVFSGE